MKAAIIAPTTLLSRYATGDYHLCLAHLVNSDKQYADFYRTRANAGDHVILDNSVIELGQPMFFSDLQRAIDKIHPVEFVLADFPREPTATLHWAEEYGFTLKGLYPEMKLMAVPQWTKQKLPSEWLYNYNQLEELSCIDSIGIPKFLGKHRTMVCEELSHMRNPKWEHHLLGTWGNPIEVKDLAEQFDWLRGVDSKAPVRAGLAGVAFHPEFGLLANRDALPPMNFAEAFDPMPIITWSNIKQFLGWAEGRTEAQVLALRKEFIIGAESSSR